MMSRLIPKIGFGKYLRNVLLNFWILPSHLFSLGWTVRIFAFITLFCFAIGSFTIKQRRPSKPFPPFSRLFDFAAFKDPCYLLLALGCWFSIFALFNPFFYVGLSAQVASPGSNVNGYYLAILCAFSIPGRVLPGLIAIKVGRYGPVDNSLQLMPYSYMGFCPFYQIQHRLDLITRSIHPNLCAVVHIICKTQPNRIFCTLRCIFGTLLLRSSSTYLISDYSICTTSCHLTLPGFFLQACVAEISPIEKVGARLGGTFAFMASAMIAGTPIAGVFIKKQTEANFKNLILFSVSFLEYAL